MKIDPFDKPPASSSFLLSQISHLWQSFSPPLPLPVNACRGILAWRVGIDLFASHSAPASSSTTGSVLIVTIPSLMQ
jgi:hypothetical protein